MKKFRYVLATAITALSMSIVACKSSESSNQVKVSFSWNIETTEQNPTDRSINRGEKYGELPSPDFVIKGYDFNGWNTRSDLKGEAVTSESVVSEDAKDHTLYGNWQGKQYLVSFNLGGGSINGVTELTPRTVTYGKMYGAMVIPNNPEKKLSTFLGWYLNPEGTGPAITYSTIVKTDSNHTLYAVYKDTRVNYTFASEDELEDFTDPYNSLELNIEDHKLVISNHSEDPRAHLVLNAPLKAGSYVDFDVEFVGEASVENEVKTSFYLYGGDENGSKIEAGQMGDPHDQAHTRKEIRDWYYGQGANNIQHWEAEKWNNGHILLAMNILEDCSTIVMMLEFGRKAVVDEEGEPTGAYVPDKTLWENNKWVINSIHLHPADYDYLKSDYDFSEKDDIESFTNPVNVEYEIEDEALKISKGQNDEDSYLEFETQHLPAGSKVEYEVQFVGELNRSSVGDVGINTYGLYPNGMRLDRKVDGTAASEGDSIHVRNWYWGGYCINNNSWDPASLVAGEFVKFATYVYEDCYGILMKFSFGSSEGYFLIKSVRVVPGGEILSRYNFANSNQLLDFSSSTNLTYTLDEDDVGNFLKVKNANTGSEGDLVLNTALKAGQKVYIEIELDTNEETFSKPYTFIVHHAQYAGKRMKFGSPAQEQIIVVKGTNKWDGAWDGSTFIVEAELTADCYGVVFQMVFGDNPDAFYKIRSIEIE